MLLLALSGGLALSGLLQLLRVAVLGFPKHVDVLPLWTVALPLAGLLVLALLAAALLLLLGTSRAHLVMLELLLVGGFGALAVAWTEARDFNVEADSTPATQLSSTVVEKQERRGRRGRRSYYLVLTDWNGGPRTKKVQVPLSQYQGMRVGQRVGVAQHPGALGARWVESIRPTE